MFQIAEQQLLIRQDLMELELIHECPVQPRINEPFVFHALLVLLPLQVQEGRSTVLNLTPSWPAAEDPSDKSFIIASAEIVLHNYGLTVSCLMGGRCLGTFCEVICSFLESALATEMQRVEINLFSSVVCLGREAWWYAFLLDDWGLLESIKNIQQTHTKKQYLPHFGKITGNTYKIWCALEGIGM